MGFQPRPGIIGSNVPVIILWRGISPAAFGVNTSLRQNAVVDSFDGMKTHTNIGLWIDHRKAVIATVSNLGEKLNVILSHADRQPGRSNGKQSTTAYESLLVRADDVTDRRFGQHLNTYYDEVIACVHEAESLLIFGPGEANGELGKRLARKKPAGRTLRVLAADKLTDQQIAAKARAYFKHPHPGFVL